MSYKLALCSEVYRTPIEETIRRLAAIGFRGIEIAPFNVAPSVDEVSAARRAEIRRVAEGEGIEIIGLHWLLVSPPGLHLTTPDDAVRTRTAEYLKSLARFAADLGGAFLVLGSPKQRSFVPGDEPRAAFERTAATLRGVAEECGACGVRLLLEPLHPAETTFLRSVEEALELALAIDHPAVGYILDCKAMSGMPLGIAGTLRRHGLHAGHFHANEPGGKGPGMGDVDFGPILEALEESGYRGWISTEPFDYSPDADTVARAALATLQAKLGRS
jgi:sugar phosphate isomerase/epimerase